MNLLEQSVVVGIVVLCGGDWTGEEERELVEERGQSFNVGVVCSVRTKCAIASCSYLFHRASTPLDTDFPALRAYKLHTLFNGNFGLFILPT